MEIELGIEEKPCNFEGKEKGFLDFEFQNVKNAAFDYYEQKES